MGVFVALGAQRDQVMFDVIAGLTAVLKVVYLQVLHGAAELAPPAVAFQHLPMLLAVAVRIKPQWRTLATDFLHQAFRLTSDKKVSCCGPGSNP